MKKIILSVLVFITCSISAQAQIMVAKLLGKEDAKYGPGYGLFSYFDIPLANENQSFRIELVDFAMFPLKNEKFFTTTADAKAYLSIKLGYKYVFSETQAGFYLLPSAGYCHTIFMKEGEDATNGKGVAGALEGGYSLAVGQKGHLINLGIKYEYDYGSNQQVMQTAGLRLSYSFNLLRKKED